MTANEIQKSGADDRPTSRGPGIGWRVYQQISAIIGAFAFLAFLTNFGHFDWRGLLATLIGAWDNYIRPPVRWLLHYMAEVPLGWVGWDVQLPQWLHDYLAVGFVIGASVIRTAKGELGWLRMFKN